ncbi:MAG: hypothetical protein HYT50_01250 [Candidatus Wildermuthbacteria bacterium]|nr:hypothetical protein [Candidatus Wildermuthbacteria bacterium]
MSKSDTVPPDELAKKIAALQGIDKNALAISIHDWESLEKVKHILNKIQENKQTAF